MNAVLTPFRLPFDPKRNVVDFGVQAELLKSKPVQRDPHLDFQSKQGVEIKAQAQGESRGIPNLPQGAAGAEISFSRENAAFVAALGVKEYQVSDQYGLQEELKELVRAAKFPPDYVVVTDIISARSATILISTGRGQSITIQADASADAAPFNARLGGKLSVFTTKFAGMNFSGARSVTPLYNVMGFSVGNKVRQLGRKLKPWGRGQQIPRIVVESIKGRPTVGESIIVRPVAAERIAIAPIDGAPFVVEPGQWTSFRVEPVLTDAKTLTTLLPTSWVADVGEVLQGGPEGVVFGSLDSEPAVGKPLTIFALGESPILIEPIDQDPFLVRLSEDEAIAVEPTEIEALDFEDAEFVWEADDDPLQFDYVAFDPELAAGEGE